MNATLEHVLVAIAAAPIAFAIVCWILREVFGRRTARRVREDHPGAWDDLPWRVRGHPRVAVEVLVSKKAISGPEVDRFRARDESLEKAIWLGLLVSAVVLLAIVLGKWVAVILG